MCLTIFSRGAGSCTPVPFNLSQGLISRYGAFKAFLVAVLICIGNKYTNKQAVNWCTIVRQLLCIHSVITPVCVIVQNSHPTITFN